MIISKLIVLSSFLILCSCASTRMRMLENSGAIRTDFSKVTTYDYEVQMEEVSFLGWNASKETDRTKTLILMFGDRCNEIKIGDVIRVNAGSTQDDKPIATWIMRVKCNNQNIRAD